eukprot:8742411-Pyramimonas_sp.AAC.1
MRGMRKRRRSLLPVSWWGRGPRDIPDPLLDRRLALGWEAVDLHEGMWEVFDHHPNIPLSHPPAYSSLSPVSSASEPT